MPPFATSRRGRQLWAIATFALCEAAHADVVIVVSSRCPLASLGTDQVSALFLGKSTPRVAGISLEPLNQADGSASRDEFEARFLGRTAAQVKSYWSRLIFSGRGRPPREVPDDAAAKRYIAAHPDTVGYLDKPQVDKTLRIVTITDR